MLRISRSHLVRYGCALALPLWSACSDATAPDRLAATIEHVPLHSEEEYENWPSTPEISGGSHIEIRGMAKPGCGAFDIDARRIGRTVHVDVKGMEDAVCVAIVPGWQAFIAVIDIPPGSYMVDVKAVGHDHRTTAVATVR